jgi:serine/threonine-protein kinase SRPK3
MIRMLFRFPKDFATSGTNSRKNFDSNGHMKKLQHVSYVSFKDTMLYKYGVYYQEAVQLAEFLSPMLRIIPEERGSAWESLHHCWLGNAS